VPENVTEDRCGRERAVFVLSVAVRGQDGKKDPPSAHPSRQTGNPRSGPDLIRGLAKEQALGTEFEIKRNTTNRGNNARERRLVISPRLDLEKATDDFAGECSADPVRRLGRKGIGILILRNASRRYQA